MPCGGQKNSPRTSSIVQVIFPFGFISFDTLHVYVLCCNFLLIIIFSENVTNFLAMYIIIVKFCAFTYCMGINS